MPAIARLLDANANRAREALRVMEDAARFLLDDEALTRRLKAIRHDLATALATLPAGWLEAARDVEHDVGTAWTPESERRREGPVEVLVAAGKRAGEALRALEEGSKTIDAGLAGRLEALRYRVYEAEAALHRRMGSAARRQWRVCVLLTERLCARGWDEVLAGTLRGGADCIQIREPGMPDRALLERVRRAIERARPAGAAVIVNDRVDVALLAGADGVHVGQDDLAPDDVRRLAGRALILGVSTHDPAEAEAAVAAGADYCGVGAMFPTDLKPARAPAGVAWLRRFLETWPRTPHLAIGGITPENVASLVEAGARGVAVSSAVCGAADPAAVVAGLAHALHESPAPSAPGPPRDSRLKTRD